MGERPVHVAEVVVSLHRCEQRVIGELPSDRSGQSTQLVGAQPRNVLRQPEAFDAHASEDQLEGPCGKGLTGHETVDDVSAAVPHAA